MDFGIARVRGSQRLTRSGSIVGTLAYMAPEQLRGEEGDDTCDLYSLAIVLYEMLSGSPPFNAASEYDLMQAQINQRPERLIPRVPGLDPKIENALLKALSKKPDQRFPSTRAFSDALGASALAHGCAKNSAQRYAADPGYRHSCFKQAGCRRQQPIRLGVLEQYAVGSARRGLRRRCSPGRCARHHRLPVLPVVEEDSAAAVTGESRGCSQPACSGKTCRRRRTDTGRGPCRTCAATSAYSASPRRLQLLPHQSIPAPHWTRRRFPRISPISSTRRTAAIRQHRTSWA